jgi:hypothetical protein
MVIAGKAEKVAINFSAKSMPSYKSPEHWGFQRCAATTCRQKQIRTAKVSQVLPMWRAALCANRHDVPQSDSSLKKPRAASSQRIARIQYDQLGIEVTNNRRTNRA